MIGRVKRAFRGPKGYKRTDERIREDVNDRLAQQDEFDPSEIEVRVENGDVTLTGSVRSRHEKFRAEEIADEVSGVNDVHNQLRIGSAQTQQTTGTSTTLSSTNSPVSRNGRA
jgi:osmotically-inducible protein OsmY